MSKLLDTFEKKIGSLWPENWQSALLLLAIVLIGSSFAGAFILVGFPAQPQPLLAHIVAGIVAWICLWHDERTWWRLASAWGAAIFCYGWGFAFGNDSLVITTAWLDSIAMIIAGALLAFISPAKIASDLE